MSKILLASKQLIVGEIDRLKARLAQTEMEAFELKKAIRALQKFVAPESKKSAKKIEKSVELFEEKEE